MLSVLQRKSRSTIKRRINKGILPHHRSRRFKLTKKRLDTTINRRFSIVVDRGNRAINIQAEKSVPWLSIIIDFVNADRSTIRLSFFVK